MTPTQRPLNLRTLLVLAIVAGLLTAWHHVSAARGKVSAPERLVVAVGRPLQSAVTSVGIVPRNLWRAMVAGPQLAAENEQLKRQCADAQARQTELMQSYLNYRALVQSLGLAAPRSNMEGQAARVIALETGPQRCRATLAVEQAGLLAEGDVVRQAAGLVGKVTGVEGKTAEVALLIDAEVAVAGLDLRSRDQGVVYPLAAAVLPSTKLKMEKLKPLSASPDLRAGDTIVSSGLDGVYPAGIPLGRIEKVVKSPGSAESVTAVLRPAVDFFRLEYVLVLPRQRR